MRAWNKLHQQCLALFGCWSMLASACGSHTTEQREYTVEVHAVSDNGAALAGVVATRSGRKLGQTTADGQLRAKLTGTEGQLVELTLSCPSGFLEAKNPVPLRLTSTRAVGRNGIQPLKVERACQRQRREVVLVVHADAGAALPVKVNGEPVMTTDADGNAHALLDVAREVKAVEIELDTSSRKELSRQRPRKLFALGQSDTVVLFEPTLATPRSVPRSHRAPEPQRHIPTRID